MAKHQDLIVSRSAARPPATVQSGQRAAVEGDGGWYAYRGVKGNMLHPVNGHQYPNATSAIAACGN